MLVHIYMYTYTYAYRELVRRVHTHAPSLPFEWTNRESDGETRLRRSACIVRHEAHSIPMREYVAASSVRFDEIRILARTRGYINCLLCSM